MSITQHFSWWVIHSLGLETEAGQGVAVMVSLGLVFFALIFLSAGLLWTAEKVSAVRRNRRGWAEVG